MMNAVELYKFDDNGVRTVQEGEQILFCAKDVAEVLGYQNTNDAINKHCHGVAKRYPISDSLGREQQARFITEGDVYRLIASSKLPSAVRFEHWLFDEVVPTIRKHGAYMSEKTIEQALTSPDFLIKLATQLKSEKEARAKAEAQVEADKPKVLFADCVQGSETSILVGEMAKILRTNGVEIGQNSLFKWLRDHGYLGTKGERYNIPSALSTKMGIMEIKETPYWAGDHQETSRTPKITGKGQIYFINKFLKDTDKKEEQ